MVEVNALLDYIHATIDPAAPIVNSLELVDTGVILEVTPRGSPVQLPWLGVAETRVKLAGRASVKVTPVASSGPLLVTVAV